MIDKHVKRRKEMMEVEAAVCGRLSLENWMQLQQKRLRRIYDISKNNKSSLLVSRYLALVAFLKLKLCDIFLGIGWEEKHFT